MAEHKHVFEIEPHTSRISCECGAVTTMDELPLAAALHAMGLELEIEDLDTGATFPYRDKGEN